MLPPCSSDFKIDLFKIFSKNSSLVTFELMLFIVNSAQAYEAWVGSAESYKAFEAAPSIYLRS